MSPRAEHLMGWFVFGGVAFIAAVFFYGPLFPAILFLFWMIFALLTAPEK